MTGRPGSADGRTNALGDRGPDSDDPPRRRSYGDDAEKGKGKGKGRQKREGFHQGYRKINTRDGVILD